MVIGGTTLYYSVAPKVWVGDTAYDSENERMSERDQA